MLSQKQPECLFQHVDWSPMWVLMSVSLAGNFNGNSKDDNLKPDHTPAANTNELGDSWQVPDPRPEWVTSQNTWYESWKLFWGHQKWFMTSIYVYTNITLLHSNEPSTSSPAAPMVEDRKTVIKRWRRRPRSPPAAAWSLIPTVWHTHTHTVGQYHCESDHWVKWVSLATSLCPQVSLSPATPSCPPSHTLETVCTTCVPPEVRPWLCARP